MRSGGTHKPDWWSVARERVKRARFKNVQWPLIGWAKEVSFGMSGATLIYSDVLRLAGEQFL